VTNESQSQLRRAMRSFERGVTATRESSPAAAAVRRGSDQARYKG
jgi:hypothetical protein